jgi:hypothetical protein
LALVTRGEPAKIFCHSGQGGTELDVTKGGHIVMRVTDAVYPPCKGEQLVLVRESDNASDWRYTKAARWVPIKLWQEVKWAMNAHETYRIVGYDHRVNGQFMPSTTREELVDQGTLLGIVKMYNRDINNDKLSPHYDSTLAGCKYTRKVRWERLCADGKWVECADPRPVHTPLSLQSK